MKILFYCDIDGTLIYGNTLADQVKDAVFDFTSRGNWFALATGRNAIAIRWITGQLAVNAPCVLLSGAALYDAASGTVTNVKPLTEQVKATLKALLDEYPALGIQAFTKNGLHNLRLNPFLQEHGIPEEIACPVSDLCALEDEQILKIGLCCEDPGQIELAASRLFSDLRQYQWNYSFFTGAEVLSPLASKGLAMKTVIEQMPEKPDCIAAAGDSPNDLSMFACADITFAPETAFPEVRKAADYIIPPPEQGGIAQALKILLARK
ncbi:MAG: HAD family hydrolase [Clostridiaceae bacterium]